MPKTGVNGFHSLRIYDDSSSYLVKKNHLVIIGSYLMMSTKLVSARYQIDTSYKNLRKWVFLVLGTLYSKQTNKQQQ